MPVLLELNCYLDYICQGIDGINVEENKIKGLNIKCKEALIKKWLQITTSPTKVDYVKLNAN